KDIKHLFVSHFHGDHIAGLRDFPEACFTYRGDAFEALSRESMWGQIHHGFLAQLLPRDFVERGSAIDLPKSAAQTSNSLSEFRTLDYWGDGSLLLVDLPGHALGHTGFVLRTDAATVFYIVDACWDV